jgi:hypothetical protein
VVPWQLRIKRKRRHRPLIEELPCLDARTLARKRLFPGNHADKAIYTDIGLALPCVHCLTLTRSQAEVSHRHGTQLIPVHWSPISGLKKSQRPVFVCPHCSRRAFRLFLSRGRFTCYRCCGGIYASQAVHSANRPALQAERLRRFLGSWAGIIPPKPSGMYRKTYSALLMRPINLPPLASRRLSDRALLPLGIYGTQIETRRIS